MEKVSMRTQRIYSCCFGLLGVCRGSDKVEGLRRPVFGHVASDDGTGPLSWFPFCLRETTERMSICVHLECSFELICPKPFHVFSLGYTKGSQEYILPLFDFQRM